MGQDDFPLLSNHRFSFVALGGVAALAKSAAGGRSDWAVGGLAGDGAGESCVYVSPGSAFDALLYVAFVVSGIGAATAAGACRYADGHRHWG